MTAPHTAKSGVAPRSKSIIRRTTGTDREMASNVRSAPSTFAKGVLTPEASQMQMGGLSGGYYIQTPVSVGYAEPVMLWVAVAGASEVGHPAGQINLLVDGTPATLTTRDFVAPGTLTLNYGESSTVFGNGINPTGQSSVLPNLAVGLAVGPHQVQASYPGDNSFNASQANYTFNVTKVDSIIADVFLAGTAVPNVPVTIIGEETGGAYEGGNGGSFLHFDLPHSKISFGTPLLYYENDVVPPLLKGRGTMPDYPAPNKMDDLLKGSDTQLNFALALIRRSKGN